VVAACVGWLGRQRLTSVCGRLALEGLSAPVEVLRDRLGVPHIYAQNAVDAVFAQGFVHAQDRLWQMDFTRRLVAGRLSEILGALALPVDRWLRILSLYPVAKEEAGRLSGRECDLLEAYAAGVNAFISGARLPIEFMLLGYHPEPWRPADTMAWEKLMAWNLSANWESELLRGQLYERLGAELAGQLDLDAAGSWPVVLEAARSMAGIEAARQARSFTGPGADQGEGRNNWVVSGQRSRSGRPLFANDMHLGLSAPAIWYENHLVGGELNVTGVSLPGAPLVISGHNGRVAWGYTAGFPDVQDLYEEHLRRTPDGYTEYEYRGAWHPASVRREEIRVKGGETVVEEVIHTRHGPVINGLVETHPPTVPLALRFTAYDPNPGVFRAIYEMNTAGDCHEFREALLGWTGPCQNTVYADTQGNIEYTLVGRVPVRAKGDGSRPVPGWDGEHEWTGYIPPEEMPHLDNPPEGFIATANNRIAGSDYPYHLGSDFLYGDRAQRISELISMKDILDVEDFKRMQFDQVSPTARVVARVIGELRVDDPELAECVRQMREWDGRLGADSPQAAIHQVLVRQILGLVVSERLGDLAPWVQGRGPNPLLACESLWGFHAWEWLKKQLEEPNSAWFDLGNGEGREEVLRLALRKTIDFLKETLGPQPGDWAWGKLHSLTFGHVLGRRTPLDRVFNRGPYPLGGDGTTIWASLSSNYHLESDPPTGPPFRFIADLGDLDHCLGLLAPGQSGQPGSPHYADQVDAWFNQGYHVMLYQRAEIEEALEARLELVPNGGR